MGQAVIVDYLRLPDFTAGACSAAQLLLHPIRSLVLLMAAVLLLSVANLMAAITT